MRHRPLGMLGLFMGLVIFGLGYCGIWRAALWEQPSVAEKYLCDKENVRVLGQVAQIKEKETYQQIFMRRCFVLEQKEKSKHFYEENIMILDSQKTALEEGDFCEVTGSAKFFESAANPGNFDAKKYYRARNCTVSVWADTVKKKANEKENRLCRIRRFLYRIRVGWRNLLLEELGTTDGGTLSAILLGEKQGMDEEIKSLYQANGIGHILAISGLHLSFIGWGMYSFLRKISGSYLAGGVGSLILLGMYLLMIGCTVSVLRALIMLLFRIGADITGRHYDGITAFFVAFFGVVFYRPLAFYDGGFWLSFGAVAGILWIAPSEGSKLWKGIFSSLAIQIMTLPIVLYFFFELTIYSVLLNVIVIPLFSVLFLMGLMGSFGIVFLRFPFFLCFFVVKAILKSYSYLCQVHEMIPYHQLILGRPKLWEIFFYYGCVIILLILLKKKEKALFLFVIAWILVIRVPQMQQMKITMIDVGQGDGIFIRGEKGICMMVDGGSSDVKKVGKKRIEPFLKSQGVSTLDYVFLTHADQDHTNGVEELMENVSNGVKIKALVFPTQTVWEDDFYRLAKKAKRKHISVYCMEQGDQMTLGEEYNIVCLAPSKNYQGELGNEASMVLMLRRYSFQMLFTGDLENEGEERFLDSAYGKISRIDVLKVGHHGSKNGTSDRLLSEFQPKAAIISAGKNNRYGHPAKETIMRLREHKIRVFCTKDYGALTVEFKGKIQYTLNYEND